MITVQLVKRSPNWEKSDNAKAEYLGKNQKVPLPANDDDESALVNRLLHGEFPT